MRQRTFTMAARPPFRLDLTVWALRRRADNAVDAWDGTTYRRALDIEGAAIELEAVQSGSVAAPELAVVLLGDRLDERTELAVRGALTRLLGLELDLSPFYRLAEGDPLLRALATRFWGVKPPRFATLFECLVNAIACQQLTLTVGVRLVSRFAGAYGAMPANGNLHAFPSPALIGGLAPSALRPLGFSQSKSRSIVELAAGIRAGEIAPTAVEMLADQEALQRLLGLRGVGRWSAEYALLRGLGRLHVFPGDDVGARNNLARWLDLREPLDYDGVQAAVRHWQPFAGLVYFHLLLGSLADRGALSDGAGTHGEEDATAQSHDQDADRSKEGVREWASLCR
jgi:DNA-3-methyladenine glycosylase II